MSLTIADALSDIPGLAQAQVVAGRKGLNHAIRWTHIVDLPDVVPWVRGGDLLLTTAFGLKDNLQVQLELIPGLVDKDLAGMVVSVGRYFREIPPEMIRLADQLDFPILTLPFDVPFVELTEAIHKRLLSEQYALLAHSLRIHKVLTRLAVEGGGLDHLAQALANLLGCSVMIEDNDFHLLAHAVVGPIDEARRRSIADGRTPREVVARLEAQGLFERMRKEPGPQHVDAIPELGMTMERIVAPILVGAQLYGYVWIIATDRSLNELDVQAIESASVVAALIMSRQEAIKEAENRFKDTLLNHLLDPDPYHAIQNIAEALATLELHQGFQVLVVEETSMNSDPPGRLHDLAERILSKEEARAVLFQRGRRLIILCGTPDPHRVAEACRTLVEEGGKAGFSLLAGISGPAHQVARVRQCYQDAVEALHIGRTLTAGNPGVWAFEELGFLHWLRALPPDIQPTNRYQRVISEMAELDRQRGAEDLRTLEAYVDRLGNGQQAARDLSIHRNTLNQRLLRMEERWGLDLRQPYALLNLLVAIKNWRLTRGS